MLLGSQHKAKMVISDVSREESLEVGKRLDLDMDKLDRLMDSLKMIKLREREKYRVYVRDLGDAHIVAGADQSKSRFLLTYNLRHYDVEKVKRELGILVVSPGTFLQYLRSLD